MKLLKCITLRVIVCAVISPSSSAQVKPFSVTLQPPAGPIRAGAEVRVKVTTTNTSDHELRFAKGFGNEEYDFEVEVRDAQGKTPPQTSSYQDLKEHPQSRWGSYSTYVLEQGKSLEDNLVVTKLYVLTQPGKYSIRVARGKRPMWQDLKQDIVKSNKITVTVTR